ncbi:MAG: NAD(P)/FAD-dependent oxidoreductase [Gammaproteobacteria bacterium]|nr:NAD(P)/FAD-dependent oxidoreductase [Gammaproteobacteria bacterium]NIR99098.1 NAD(P)/FAD-dependent oxidoreductase [Gammaproteobacteria bacterium]NIT64730.1 NAD(P)/FAD-dependent oxidoreductase [Gammaproteobacteria bacterium]NIV21688.1 FAD-dependent oxidoreductase [Gammaproteobacteria bacterium]NIX10559.1 FAD-dependent oxidoreductase [Gammaproteobacteria bacterium]
MHRDGNNYEFDVVVIGSGPGGYRAAVTAAQSGARVAVVERAVPGGTCLNEGCIPKKTLVHLANLIEDVNALDGRGITGTIAGDLPAAMNHKDQVIREVRNTFPVWLKRLGVRIYRGSARLLDPCRIEITTAEDGTPRHEVLRTRRVVLAAGSRPRRHPACPADGVHILDSSQLLARLGAKPESVLFVGGGTIGAELAFFLSQFGSRVTVIDGSSRLLNNPGIPERASEMLQQKFERLGIDVRTGVSAASSCVVDGQVRVRFTDGRTGVYEKVVVAIGREPVTEDLNLEQAGVLRHATGAVVTNEYLETTAPGIYAVGDIKLGPGTANAALHDGKIAGANAANGNHLRTNYHLVPIVVDSALEIAAVGLTEEQAEDAGFEPDAARGNYRGSPKARGRQDFEGFIEVVHDEETGQLLGGCIVGPEAGEQIQMLTAACQSPRGLWLFTDINYSHPSWCEELEHATTPYAQEFTKSGKEVFRPGIYAGFSTKR